MQTTEKYDLRNRIAMISKKEGVQWILGTLFCVLILSAVKL